MKKNVILIIALILGLAIIANADVTIQRKSVLNSLMGLGGSESQETQYIKADKSCQDMNTKFTSGMMKSLTSGKPTATNQIVRVDKQLIWNLDPQKKTYTEMDFAYMRENMKQAMAQMGEMNKKPEGDDLYTWTIEMKPAGPNETVNGFECKHVAGKAIGVNKKLQSDTVTIDYQCWFGQNVIGMNELRQYEENYAKALGLDQTEMQQGIQPLLRDYGESFKKLAENFKDAGGYPIKTIIEVSKSAQTKKADKEAKEGEEQEQSMSGIMGKLGSKLGKKVAPKDDKGGGADKPFSMSTEVISIQTSAITDSKFEVPADFKKMVGK